MSNTGRNPGRLVGHDADHYLMKALLQAVASVFFVVAMLLSGILALAVASVALHALGPGDGFLTLDDAELIALWAVIWWIPTILLLVALSRLRDRRV